jgi:uncharacterized protein
VRSGIEVNVFLDSSALVKRYVAEFGRDEVLSILASATQLGLSAITPTEVISAFARKRREKRITRAEYARVKSELFENIAQARIVGVADAVQARAVDLLERHALRSADAIQIASAEEWACDVFVTADRRQYVAAGKRGLGARLVGN